MQKVTMVYQRAVANLKCVSVKNFMQFVACGEVCVHNSFLDIDSELKHIAENLFFGNLIECMKKREAFISLKDRKGNFENMPKCRFINTAKSDSGKISKLILDKINTQFRTIL